MKRWWAVLGALLLLLLLLWMSRRQSEEMPAAAIESVTSPTAPAPMAVPVVPRDAEAPGGPPSKILDHFDPMIEKGVGIRGRVLHGDRRPAPDLAVTVSLDGKVLGEVRTGPDGGYAFPPIDVPADETSDFVFTYLVRDGKGRAARDTLRMRVLIDPEDEFRFLTLQGCILDSLLLRESASLVVRVMSGGAPVEGASVWAEEETPLLPSTGPMTTGRDGLARIEDVPLGRWTVLARSAGHGAGRARVVVPSAGAVDVALSPRVLEIEAVDATTLAPVEGVRFEISERRAVAEGFSWETVWPAPVLPPTDSSGRTRLEGAGAVELALVPIPPGRKYPLDGAKPVEVDGQATKVRVPVPALRTVSWPVESGERGVPPDGSGVAIGEERFLRDATWGKDGDLRWKGTMRGDLLVVTGVDPGPFRTMARAADGSLARIEVNGESLVGPAIRFFAPRRLVVRVKDEDGKQVRDPVALLSPSGEAVAQPEIPDDEGKAVFEGLYAGEVVVCALARWEWGGAEVARVDLAGGDRTQDVVVGRMFTVAARFKVGGKASLPERYELRWLTPGPPVEGRPHEESVDDPEEDVANAVLRLRVRPWAPGKPVILQVTVPGRKPLTREVPPPAAGGEVVVDIDLD